MDEQAVVKMMATLKWTVHNEVELYAQYTTKSGMNFQLLLNREGRVELWKAGTKLYEFHHADAAAIYAAKAAPALDAAIKEFTDDLVSA